MLMSLVMDYRHMTVYAKEGYKQMTAIDVDGFGHGLQTHDSVYQRRLQTNDCH